MAGFDAKKSILEQLDEEGDGFDLEDLNIGDGDVNFPTGESGEESDNMDGAQTRAPLSSKKKNTMNKTVIICACVAASCVVLVGGFLLYRSSRDKKKLAAQQMQQEVMQNSKQSNNPTSDEKTTAGAANLYGSVTGQNTDVATSVTESSVVKSLQGADEPANYTVRSSKTVRDFIDYKKHRGVTGNGLEFYWLEVTYKGQPYIVQISYQIFNQLDNEGQTIVDAEVLTLNDNQEIVSYMNVVQNAKSLINKK